MASGIDPLTFAIFGPQAAAVERQNRQRSERFAQQARIINKQTRQQMAIAQQKAQVEQSKAINKANLIQSRLRVAAGESGIGYGGTFDALTRQVDFDTDINLRISNQNLSNRIRSLRLGTAASLISARPLSQSVELAALSSGVEAFQTGLSLGASGG